ncbi:SURF1 family protein [Roseomonas marmotae]|uniref:SURF1-like protein n=1 Tax=Roseomonas marmotae TaxID=2768161 RepID=A0ABS3KFY4_9PROT|nr:SURF1 family protein [Roseomonas marmotae]MBO1076389.1 SURF1 family protein [Roseomonas marmotae]QTI79402.1 SURF1 family protein [Roseomonas marmotae]
MNRWRRLLIPTLVLLPVLAILAGLGTWQLQRLHWKTDLLARLAIAEASPPLPLSEPPEPYTKVFTEGRFLHDREARLGVELRGTTLGTHLLTPLERPGAAPLLVDRGWVPLEGGQIDRPEGPLRVEGYIRPGESAGLFSATDDTAGRRFYTFDPHAIGAALELPETAPYGLVAMQPAGSPAGAALPQPARHMPRPTNSHLGYVITWYGLALSALGVFIAWARIRLKEPADGSDHDRL